MYSCMRIEQDYVEFFVEFGRTKEEDIRIVVIFKDAYILFKNISTYLQLTHTHASGSGICKLRTIRHTYSYMYIYSRDAELGRVSLHRLFLLSMDAYRF